MDRFIYITSEDSGAYFPENKTYKFKVHLKLPLSFSGFWKVALVEFHGTVANKRRVAKAKSDFAIYIYTNICKGSIVCGIEKPLLRRLELNSTNGWNYILDSPFYVPLKLTELLEFEVEIKTGDGAHATFLAAPLFLTLHFKQYPFYADFESL